MDAADAMEAEDDVGLGPPAQLGVLGILGANCVVWSVKLRCVVNPWGSFPRSTARPKYIQDSNSGLRGGKGYMHHLSLQELGFKANGSETKMFLWFSWNRML